MEIPKLLWHIKQRQDPKSNSMPVQIGEARSPTTLGHFLGRRDGASGRRFPQCRDCKDPPLALARDSATERRIRCPGAGASSGRRCAAGGWRALCTAGTITCKFDGGSRHSTLSVPHHSPSVAHGRRSLTRVTLFFLVSKARPFIPLLAPNCSRLALWSSISTGSQGSLKKQGTAWLGRAWRVALSLALSTLSVQRLQLALHLASLSSPHLPLTIPLTTDNASRSFIHSHSPRPAPPRPAHTHAHSLRLVSRRVLIRSQRRSFFILRRRGPIAGSAVSVGPRPWVGWPVGSSSASQACLAVAVVPWLNDGSPVDNSPRSSQDPPIGCTSKRLPFASGLEKNPPYDITPGALAVFSPDSSLQPLQLGLWTVDRRSIRCRQLHCLVAPASYGAPRVSSGVWVWSVVCRPSKRQKPPAKRPTHRRYSFMHDALAPHCFLRRRRAARLL